MTTPQPPYPPQSPAPAPPKRKRRKWPWIVAGIPVAIILIGIIAAIANPSSRQGMQQGFRQGMGETATTTPVAAAAPHSAPGTGPAATTTYDGAAVLLQSAGPLHAHLGGRDGNTVLCDADTATATDTSDGVQVTVNFQGPANLQVSTLDADGQGQNVPYTEGSQETGHVFDVPGPKLSQLQTLDVTVSSAAGGGDCQLVNNMN